MAAVALAAALDAGRGRGGGSGGVAVVVDKDGSLWCGVGFHLLQLHNAVSLICSSCHVLPSRVHP